MTEIGRRVRTLRKARHWTQTELAEQIGAKRMYIARLEIGMYNPSTNRTEQLAAALGVTTDQLLTDPPAPSAAA